MSRGISVFWVIPITILYASLFFLIITLVLGYFLNVNQILSENVGFYPIILSLTLYLITLTTPLNTLVNYMLITEYSGINPSLLGRGYYLLLISFIFPYVIIYTLFRITMANGDLRNLGRRWLTLSIATLGLTIPIWLYKVVRGYS